MKKFALGVLIGGVAGSAITIDVFLRIALRSPGIQAVVADAISDRVQRFLYEEKPERPVRLRSSYRSRDAS
jgi:hypothetical protein